MLRFYNTRTKTTQEFKPLHHNTVGLYTCGPTVYAPQHLGNMRSYIFVDVLKRALRLNRYNVRHVMNITDVGHLTSNEDTGEDKMEASARRQHKSAAAVASEITERFLNDLRALNVELPDVMPRATETIDWQIGLIQQLEAKRYTYRTSDGIYFDTSKFKTYGQLGGQKASDKKAGARVEVNPEKRHPSDFALWKFSKLEDQRQMEWGSPWGTGFPGWHIECSAMSMHELGEQFDIHTGGIDHIPVHHENEIAQSEAATGKHPFVNFWLHGEFLVLPDKRMGKSEGNTVTLQNVIERGIDPLAFRYLVLQTHYRSKLTFSWKALEAAQLGLHNLWLMVDTANATPKIGCAEFEQRFRDALNDGLDTPQALSIMHQMLKSEYPSSAKLQSLTAFENVLALGLTSTAKREHFKPLNQTLSDAVNKLIREREEARKHKNWQRADELRTRINDMLAPFRRTLEDTHNGPEIRPQ